LLGISLSLIIAVFAMSFCGFAKITVSVRDLQTVGWLVLALLMAYLIIEA